jgi:hypothetical protein
MASVTRFELLDGSELVLFDAVAPNVARELEAWALVPEVADDDPARDASVWKDALDAGPLLYVVFSGVVGNAAWSVFPAAARYLRARMPRKAPGLDAVLAGSRAREAAAAASGAAESDIALDEVERDGEGTWKAKLRLADGRVAKVRMDAGGVVTHVRLK